MGQLVAGQGGNKQAAATESTGGTISIVAGLGGPTQGNGGSIKISGGKALRGTGGLVQVGAGSSGKKGNGGGVSLLAGDADGEQRAGGEINLQVGAKGGVASGVVSNGYIRWQTQQPDLAQLLYVVDNSISMLSSPNRRLGFFGGKQNTQWYPKQNIDLAYYSGFKLIDGWDS